MDYHIDPADKKILIIDGEYEVVTPLEFLLAHNGYIVTTAYNGEDALKLVSTFMPDLILLDILTPVIDGFQICQTIRENKRYRDMKIIFLTAIVRDVDIAKGLALGADACITKPFSNAALIKTLKEVFSGIKNGIKE